MRHSCKTCARRLTEIIENLVDNGRLTTSLRLICAGATQVTLHKDSLVLVRSYDDGYLVEVADEQTEQTCAVIRLDDVTAILP